MSSLNIKSVMLDTSFCIRLMHKNDSLHQNAFDYFKHFLSEKITAHISTIAVAEYAVVDDPGNLPLNNLQIETFDFIDAKTAGLFHKAIKGKKANLPNFNRRIIANDVKILAQINNRSVDAIISKGINSFREYVQPLSNANLLQVKFLDLNIPLATALGQLF
jgi:predicted nucleic acid-binding protein